MFFIFISIVQIIIFVANAVVYEVFVHFVAPQLSLDPTFLLSTRIFFVVFSCMFVGAATLAYRSYSKIGKILYTIAAVWLGTVWFLFIASILVVILNLFFYNTEYIKLISNIIFLVACLTSLGSLLNAFTVSVTSYNVALSWLPDIWKGKKAIIFSDTHVGNIRGKEFLNTLADLILSRKPDIVFLVGDLFDGPPVPPDFISPLKKLADVGQVPLGTFYVTGNHEEFDDPTIFLNAVRETGIRILDNQTENVLGVTIAGVDHRATESREDYKKVLDTMLLGVDKQTPIMLLKHVPSNVDIAEAASVDLCFHGHTHNAQIWPLMYLARRMFKGFEYGLKKWNDMHVITSSGAGTWGPPQRFFTKSEIVEVVFSREDDVNKS